jgi:hypothetical protein
LEVLNILRNIVRFSVRFLFALLVAYWLIFLGYTIQKLTVGGTTAVVAWYQHVGSQLIPADHGVDGVAFRLRPWSLLSFLTRQLTILVITAVLAVPVFRWKKQRRFST